jgi:CRISPR-associated exonuclease Cas4
MALEPISASGIERYGYCPLSWWLSLQSEVTSEELEQGDKEHAAVAEDLADIVTRQRRASFWERNVLGLSIVATMLGILGISFIGFNKSAQVSMILGVLAIVWVVAAIFLLLRSGKYKDKKESSRYEQIVAGFAVVAMVIALNAVTLLEVNPDMARGVEVLALLFLIGASLALYISLSSRRKAERMRREHAINGEIKYVDKDKPRMLRSERYGLLGRPDYILEVEGGMVPVEMKSGRTPRGPLFSHILQVGAYCLMLQEEGAKVSHGILKYGDIEHEIEFDQELKDLVISKVAEMRELQSTGEAHRNHHRPGKCHSCSRREMCPERLE